MRCVCELWDFSASCCCFTSCLNACWQIIHVVSRQGVAEAAASSLWESHCVCEECEHIMYIMQAGVLCETLCYASMWECVCMRCNSHFKSKSLTASLMPAASQVMKGLVLVAADTSIIPSLPRPFDGESITASMCHSVSLTLACIIKVYSPESQSSIPSSRFPNDLPPQMQRMINMKWIVISKNSYLKQKTSLSMSI